MTTLLRWNPLRPAAQNGALIRDDFDRLFDQFLWGGSAARPSGDSFLAPADILETPEEFVVRLDLPGVAQKDVKVTLLGDNLTIRGERKFEDERAAGNLRYRERRSGSFERSFTLTTPVRGDQVKATYRDGVLEVHVPKADQARTREIEVQVG